MAIYKTDDNANSYEGPRFLDNPPEHHSKLLDYGERPYWSPDGKRIAFVESNYGDIAEIDLETRKVRNLTHDLGDHHSFLRVLFLPTGDYILIGPREFKDRHTSRHIESELWFMDREARKPPRPLGRRIYEGCGVSTTALRLTYSMNGHHDPDTGGPDQYEVHVTELEPGPDGPGLGADRVIYRASGGHRPEPQDFRHQDTEVIMAEYLNRPRTHPEDWKCVVKGVEIKSGTVRTYIDEPLTHNECEGIFPDGQHICLESSCDTPNSFPPVDLWKLKLDGSQRRVRMTQTITQPPWRASNSNVSPDGRWLAFMINTYTSEPGRGMGLGLLDLAAWEKSPQAEMWMVPDGAPQDRES
jgi:hypothetical protein